VLWTEFIKHVLNTGAASKYRTILLPFGIELLRKVQYLENPSYLNDLEDGLENVDGLTEFDQFIDEVILILKPLSEFYPGEMIGDLVSSTWIIRNYNNYIAPAIGKDTRGISSTCKRPIGCK
jgi:hypothetical protein